VSSRTYLSIGDVLTLLREEFPDVTISKIRFLESQGLVNPERSPSGYRKFFDHDVERLRWVLRQQREHFLPLKVIRDRLADGELDDAAGAGAAAGSSTAAGNGKPARPANAARTSTAASASPTATATAAPGTQGDEQPTKADEEAMARILADASRRTAQLPDAALMPSAAAARRSLQVVDEVHAPPVDAARQHEPVSVGSGAALGASARSAGSGSGSGSAPSTHSAGGETTGAPGPEFQASGGGGGTAETSGAKEVDAAKRPAETAPAQVSNQPGSGRGTGEAKAVTRPGRQAADAAGAAAAGGASSGASTTSSVVTGASMTGEEVCAASGLSAEELAGLEGFGLVVSVNVAGIPTYDEDALTLANLAAQFRTYGIEARHLRLYRNSVDRELGLIEQVIIPLLRQRNPEARQRAAETSDQLASLGQSMRATLLHQALRQHLGG
jgi:DNA-binding transcriptional MerR regulator